MSLLPDFPGIQWGEGYIYYIISAETGRMKIGYTKGDPKKRLKSLQTGSPTKLDIVAVHPGDLKTEADLHRQFSTDRTHGEWFDVSDDLLVHIAEIYILTIALHKNAGSEEQAEWAKTGLAGLMAMLEEEQMPEGDTIQ